MAAGTITLTITRQGFYLGTIDALKAPVPKGVLLRMTELRKSGLFKDFIVVGRIEDFEQRRLERMGDPVVLGSVKKLDDANHDEDFYFVAKW